MKYLLDTNVCIRYLNGRSERVRERLEASSPDEIALCSVVRAELLYGVLKSAQPQRNANRLARFLGGFPCLPFDEVASATYAEIRFRLETIGKPVGPNDLMIAAIAVANRLALVTHNTREFGRIEGLTVEDWEASPA